MSKLGLLIVAYNGRQYLDELFESLSAVKYPNWQIFFIDNASVDGSAEYVREKFAGQFNNLRIVKLEKNLGFAGGNNVGLKMLAKENFDFAYLLNQDTVVSPDFLEQAVAAAGEGVGSVQSLIRVHGEDATNTLGNAIHFLGFGYCYGYGWGHVKTEEFLKDWQERDPQFNIAYASGAGALYSMPALNKVGFFEDDYFMYHEDLDLGWRLRLAGCKNVLAPASVIEHKYEFSKSIGKYYWMERNRYITIFKNYSAWTLILIAPALIMMEAGLFAFSFASGWWRTKLNVYNYFFQPKNWRKIVAKRRALQKQRAVSDRRLAQFFVGDILFQDMDNWILRDIANPFFNFYWQLIRKIL
jgi:hypothetical protein